LRCTTQGYTHTARTVLTTVSLRQIKASCRKLAHQIPIAPSFSLSWI
jgi:hypothetical protein